MLHQGVKRRAVDEEAVPVHVNFSHSIIARRFDVALISLMNLV